jgi:hypothetical protein
LLLSLLLLITPPGYCCPLVCVLLPLLLTRNCLNEFCHSYIGAERTWTDSKHISRGRYSANLLERRSDVQKTPFSVVCWTLFTELLPGNALIRCFTVISYRDVNWIQVAQCWGFVNTVILLQTS